MGVVHEYHPEHGWRPSIPEPFWVRRWFRWRPACYPCRIRFRDRSEHDEHYRREHLSVKPCNDRRGGYVCAKPRGHDGSHQSCGGREWAALDGGEQ